MSEQILKRILDELKEIKSEQAQMKSQLDENTQMTKAIYNRQEETDAKLESLTFNVHKLQGEVTSIKETVTDIKGEIEYTYEKTSKNELEIFKLRKEQTK